MDASFIHDKRATFVGNEKKYDGYWHAYILIHMALFEFPLCDKDMEFYQLQEITYPKREQLKKILKLWPNQNDIFDFYCNNLTQY